MEEALKLKKSTYNLWTFIISKLVSSLGSSIYSFGISFYILSATGSAMNFALNLISSILPRTLLAPVAGYLADTYSKKAIVIISQISSTIALLGLLIYSLLVGPSLGAIYITTALLSVTSTFSGVTFSASIASLVNPERIQKAMSFNQTSISLATIGGPALGGLLYGLVSLPVFISIFIFAYLIATLLDSTMDFKLYSNKKESEGLEKKEKMLESIKGGIRYLRKNELISRIVIVSLFVNFFFGAFQVGFSYILINLLKIESFHFGFIEASTSVGMLVVSVYIGLRRTFKSPLTISKWGIVGMGLVMAMLSLPLLVHFSYWGSVIFYIILLFTDGALMMFVNTPIGVLMQNNIDEEYRGRVFSLMETMAMALMPLAMILFGVLYDFIPAQYILITSSTALIIIVLLIIPTKLIRKFSATKEKIAELPTNVSVESE